MTLALLVGAGAAASTALAALAVRRVPRRDMCPECECETDSLVAPWWLRPAGRWLGVRWCAGCSWQGVGRLGPDPIPGVKLAHDSGFHWGADELGPDLGFQWAARPIEATEKQPPHHRSGFRFAHADERDSRRGPGFEWADGAVRRAEVHPSGFRWRREPERAPPAEWGPPPRPRSGRPPFRWADPSPEPSGFEWGNRARR